MPDTPPRAADTVRDQATLGLPEPSDAPRALPVEQHSFVTRYVQRKVIGVGGMGEVRLCTDSRIGREVALKVQKPEISGHDESRRRFLREARLQGQLEHPSIVPVYDLGSSQDGEWFTMKRIRGRTLHEVLHGDGDLGLRKLLAAFVQVCQAVAYAHARGVVHRDLKPANVMLGDFGEVYVLDWGVAKVLGTADLEIDDDDVPTRAGHRTQHGTVMGTPGYMSPEQALGKQHDIDARTDVYALGAILFEILTRQSLHPLDDAQAALASIVPGVDASPRRPAPEREPPPELDAVCTRATALDRDARYGDAGELATAVEKFLDGDRDLALRRAMADEQIEEARRILARSDGDATAHAAALRALHRAHALDATNEVAVTAMARLLLKPPTKLPEEAEEELARDDERERRTTARDGTIAFLAWFALSPLMLLAGVRSLGAWVVMVGLLGACAAFSAWIAFRRLRPDDRSAWILLVLSSASIALATSYLGPFVLVPGWACQNTLVFALYAPGRRRWGVVTIGTMAIAIPLALELLGLVPPSFGFENGRLVILPRMIDIPEIPTLLLLLLGNVAMVFVPSFIVARVRDQALATKRALVAHLARLRQLIPDEAR